MCRALTGCMLFTKCSAHDEIPGGITGHRTGTGLLYSHLDYNTDSLISELLENLHLLKHLVTSRVFVFTGSSQFRHGPENGHKKSSSL